MNILMVAAENDALPGGKVGGIGDVLRDIPQALAKLGHRVDVVTPGYGMFSKLPGAEHAADVPVYFAGFPQLVEIYRLPSPGIEENVTLWALEHPLFSSCGAGRIYCDDGPMRPFATDASKFALFSAAVCKAVCMGHFSALDVIHLHDWHAGLVALLREHDTQFAALKNIRTVFTVHNLALQGVRPLHGDESSPASWFRQLALSDSRIVDPGATNCINPMRVGINLSDAVHVVSPGYAREVIRPQSASHGFASGEGLHEDLARARDEGRLHGILNGCDYSAEVPAKRSAQALLSLCRRELDIFSARDAVASSAHMLAWRRIDELVAHYEKAAPMLLTSIGRLTAQKMQLLQHVMSDGRAALDHLLERLGDTGILVLLGSGDPVHETFLRKSAARARNLVYLQGYSDTLVDDLYASGDLFLMPSLYEPCGISQMLAMRAGQPCFVHSVGGLADTVQDSKNGFAFSGVDIADSAAAMLDRFDEVLKLHSSQAPKWKKIASAAQKSRFTWDSAAASYLDLLYAPAARMQ